MGFTPRKLPLGLQPKSFSSGKAIPQADIGGAIICQNGNRPPKFCFRSHMKEVITEATHKKLMSNLTTNTNKLNITGGSSRSSQNILNCTNTFHSRMKAGKSLIPFLIKQNIQESCRPSHSKRNPSRRISTLHTLKIMDSRRSLFLDL